MRSPPNANYSTKISESVNSAMRDTNFIMERVRFSLPINKSTQAVLNGMETIAAYSAELDLFLRLKINVKPYQTIAGLGTLILVPASLAIQVTS